MKKFLSVFICFTMILTTLSIVSVGADSKSDDVTIFYTNDMHASVENLSYVSSIKKNTENSLLVDAGDAVQGSPLATYTNGDDIIQMMNATGYDVATLGNHEFDYGSDIALKNAQNANFQVISANTYNADGSLFLDGVNSGNGAYYTKNVNGHLIGFFGIESTETAYKTNAQKLNGVTFKDEVETSQKMVDTLKKLGCQVIIGLCHVGIAPTTDPTSHKIAQAVSGIDVIIDGHSHSVDQSIVNGTYICQTGTKLSNLGKLNISFDADGKANINSTLLSQDEYKTMAEPDESVASLYQKLNDDLKPILNEKVGESASKIFYSASDEVWSVRLEETPCADLVTDAMKKAGQDILDSINVDYPLVVLQNGGAVRSNLPVGTVTKGDVLNVLPYSNTIQISEITPKDIYTALENGVGLLNISETTGFITSDVVSGAFPQVAGMSYVVDTDMPVGQKIKSVVLDGSTEPLDKNDTTTKIAIASNDYELSGGDGYTIFKDLPKIAEGGPLDGALENYIESISNSDGQFCYSSTSNRIITAQHLNTQFKQESANHLKTTLSLGLSSNTQYTVSVDNTYTVNVVSDGSGNITLNAVTPGYHTIYIPDNNTDYYTSTYTGINIANWSNALLGDADKDGSINIMDVTVIQEEALENIGFDYEQNVLADINGDGVINIQDATCLQCKLIEK